MSGKKSQWLALGLSLVRPGLGQLYNQQPRKAVVLFLLLPYGLLGLTFILTNIAALKVVGLLFCLTVVGVGVGVWNLSDAYRNASSKNPPNPHPHFGRWHILLGVFLADSFFFSFLDPQKYFRAAYFESYVMPTQSMAPTLIEGDRFYVDKRSFRERALPVRGELVGFHSIDKKTIQISRVVGLPGDKIEMRNGVLF